MRLTAYILAADPTWLRTSVLRYYDRIDRLIVSYDRHGQGWTGAPIDVDSCLAAVRDIDADSKVILAPGDFSRQGDALLAETRQRQAALDVASEGADWVLQLDTDEVLPRVQPLVDLLHMADACGVDSVEWPMRVLYRRLSSGRYLQVVRSDGLIHVEYPGPVAVRPGTSLSEARRSSSPYIRPIPRSGVGGLQLERTAAKDELRMSGACGIEDVIVHNSWARSARAVRSKVASWGHNQGLRTDKYYYGKWLPTPYTWRFLRDFHPFAEDLWPRLAPYDIDAGYIHPAEEKQ